MASCPFPVIPEYLAKQSFPSDQIAGARVTCIWTQDAEVSRHVADASLIERVVDDYVDMIGQVDAILLARDDAEHHYEMSAPFIKAGLPIYIDKPLALSQAEARRILDLQTHDNQVYSCSALAFARELTLADDERATLGTIRRIEATIPNSWEKYAVHIVEPVLNLIDAPGDIVRSERKITGEHRRLAVTWGSGVETVFTTTGSEPVPIRINIRGEGGETGLAFTDTYAAFKASLQRFIDVVRGDKPTLPRDRLMRVMEVIERGLQGE